MYGWSERPSKASVKHRIGGENKATIYTIGKYEVTVPGDEIEVTYSVPYHRTTDPRAIMPNMEISDGQIRIEVVDLVDIVLSRMDPVELAQSLWQNEEVKEAFMDCLTSRWSENGIEDADRRSFLIKVRDAVHSKALDRLADKMASLEYQIDKRAHGYQEIGRINDTLRNLNVTVDSSRMVDGEWVTEPKLLQFDGLDRSVKAEDGGFTRGELEIAGAAWTEAREYWRAEVAKRFPGPLSPEPLNQAA